MSSFRQQHMDLNWHELAGVDNNVPAVNASLSSKAALVGRVGTMMLSVGTGAWRVRAAMNKICRALGIVCSADIGLLTIVYTCIEKDESLTNEMTLRTTGVNTDKLTMLEHFADGFSEKAETNTVGQFLDELDKIEKAPAGHNAFSIASAAALACGCFTFLLGGGPVEMALAFFGSWVGQFVRKKLIERRITLLANIICSAAAACCVYMIGLTVAGLFGISDIHQSGYICSMLFVIPGFPLITGCFDLAKLEMRSGIERLTYAVIIITIATMTGWLTAMMLGFYPNTFPEYSVAPTIKLVIRLVTSFLAVYGFSFLFNSPRKLSALAGLVGMFANVIRLELIDFALVPVPVAAFIGTFTAGILATVIRKHAGYPRITITVPSIVIMVPGMYLYKAFYYLGQSGTTEAGKWISDAFLIIISISLGLITARMLTDTNFRKSS